MNASENIVSSAVHQACGSVFIDCIAEGWLNKRYHSHIFPADALEALAVERAKKMCNTDYHVNVQPHSGTNANLAVYLGLLKPGDNILAMKLSHSGHITHGSKGNFSGQIYNCDFYGLNPDTDRIDLNIVEKKAKEFKPKLIIVGASSYPRKIEYQPFMEIAKSVNAYLLADISHIIGLIIAGEHPNPFGYADIITSSTYKTLSGPRGGMIYCRKELAKNIDRGVFPGSMSDPHMQIVTGKAVCFQEALSDGFKKYQKQIALNSRLLASELIDLGFSIITNGTDNHLILLNVKASQKSGFEAQKILEECGISSNMNVLPNDPNPSKPSGLRIGTPAVTTLGATEEHMSIIAQLIYRAIIKNEDPQDIYKDVQVLRKKLLPN